MNRRAYWFALMNAEGRFIRFAEMFKTQMEKQNKFYAKHGSGYKWVLYTAYLNEIEIKRFVA